MAGPIAPGDLRGGDLPIQELHQRTGSLTVAAAVRRFSRRFPGRLPGIPPLLDVCLLGVRRFLRRFRGASDGDQRARWDVLSGSRAGIEAEI